MSNSNDINIELFKESSINQIRNSNFLEDIHLQILESIKNNIEHAYVNKQMYRTETEILTGVLNDEDFPTYDSKYWQCIREMDAMYNELLNQSFEYNELVLQKELIKTEINILKKEQEKLINNSDLYELEKNKINIKLKENEINKLEFKLMNIKLSARDRIRELELWSNLIDQLSQKIEFSNKDPNEHQLLTLINKYYRYITILENSNDSSDDIMRLINKYKGILYKLFNIFKSNEMLYNKYKDYPIIKNIKIEGE
jgi:hypothetical protein